VELSIQRRQPATRHLDEQVGVIAFTREVSQSIAHCELTHLDRTPIDVARARTEHAAYEQTLAGLGCEVRRVRRADDLPDAVFIEDTAVVLDEMAIITRPGAASRRAEIADVAEALRPLRDLREIRTPGTMDGGDVLRIARTLYVGVGGRTNEAGIEQLRVLTAPHGYEVRAVPFTGCLHLKTAATLVGGREILVNPDWVDATRFDDMRALSVDHQEPFGANALLVGHRVIYGDQFPRTRAMLEKAGLRVTSVPASELAKAEGGVTCCSILVA
jgi:dimethylargininase